MVLSVGKKIGAGFALALLLLVVIGVAAYHALTAFMQANARMTHVYVVMNNLDALLSQLQDVEASAHGYVITGKDAYLAPYHAGTARLSHTMSELRRLTLAKPRQQRRLDRLEPLIEMGVTEAKGIVTLRQRDGFEAAATRIYAVIGSGLMDNARAVIAEIRDEEERLLRVREDHAANAARYTMGMIFIGIPLSIAGLWFVAYRITHNIAHPLSRLTTCAQSIAAGDLSTLPHMDNRADEVGVLTRAFIAMVESLRAYRRDRDNAESALRHLNADLEGEVGRRTSELRQTNNRLQAEVDERLRAEEALAQAHEHLKVTLESIGDGVITTDTEGRVTLLNSVAQALTGWTQTEAAGRPLTEVLHIVHEETRAICANPVSKVLSTGEIVELANHTMLIAKDGVERVIADSAAPIRDRMGHTIGVVLVFRDVTEKNKMEQDLVQRQKLDSVGLLAGGIAHDFNNLLTAILGNISLARLSRESPDLLLNEAEKACVRARDLTQQLLTFAKGGAPIKKLTSLRPLAHDSVVFALRGSNVRCEWDIDDKLWPVNADAGQINQALHNIVINAKEAMPKGGTLTIRMQNATLGRGDHPRLLGDYVHITIQDEGIGIRPEVLARIFEPYFTTKRRGSGLGLATAYSIVQKHDGYIDVQSAENVGTRFHVYLPAVSTLGDRALSGDDADATYLIPGSGRILVMDDEEAVRTFAALALTQCGYEVSVATCGEEALELFRAANTQNHPFDAVILDLTIPGGMGGAECVARIREIDTRAQIIASSGYATDPIMANPRQFGFDAIVTKPYRPQTLSAVMARLFATRT